MSIRILVVDDTKKNGRNRVEVSIEQNAALDKID